MQRQSGIWSRRSLWKPAAVWQGIEVSAETEPCRGGTGSRAGWFGQQLWFRSLTKKRWEEGLATGGGAERERVLDMGKQQDGVTHWKCKYASLLQDWNIQTSKPVDSGVRCGVYGLSM